MSTGIQEPLAIRPKGRPSGALNRGNAVGVAGRKCLAAESSTRREFSQFENVAINAGDTIRPTKRLRGPRSCRECNGQGHDKRNCPIRKVVKDVEDKDERNSIEKSLILKRKVATEGATYNAKKPKVNSSITSFFSKPKSDNPNTVEDSTVLSTSKFDKEAWVNTLTSEQKKLLKLEIDTLHESWIKELKDDLVKPSFLSLKRFLQKEKDDRKTVFPPEKDIYSWSRYTPLSTVKAVIIGQDPYHNFSQAHGLSFSVNPPTVPPPSLRNIFTALKNDYPQSFRPPPNNTGQLTPWARQGVLLLNTCLTVRAHEANSHANHGWETFTQRVIDVVAKKRTNGVVFLAWGTPARKRVDKVDKSRHLVLLSVHPSPLSASRGWFECGHFRKTNEWLAARYGSGAEIDWNLNKDDTKLIDKNTPNNEYLKGKDSTDEVSLKSAKECVVFPLNEIGDERPGSVNITSDKNRDHKSDIVNTGSDENRDNKVETDNITSCEDGNLKAEVVNAKSDKGGDENVDTAITGNLSLDKDGDLKAEVINSSSNEILRPEDSKHEIIEK
ncbi:hypothetical protein EPUL_005577, partial [Erysiphe pulchra]